MRRFGVLLALGGFTLMLACGGSSSSGGSSPITSVAASCAPPNIMYGQTSQCSASVTGTGSFNSGVTWSASAGSISNSGLFSAPSSGNLSLAVAITATSTQDSTKRGTITVIVNPQSSITSVTVTCSPSTVSSGQTSQCSATVMGTGSFSSAVSWATTAGQISSSGLLTAPIVSSTINVTVTATSTQDSTKSGTTTVTVNPTQSTITSVTVVCSPSTVQPPQTSQCSATVMGTGNFSTTVTWTASAGQISSSGLLAEPIVSSPTNVTVTATSTQDSTKSGTATVMVNPTQAANNVAPIIVDSGPDPQNAFDVNVPFVSITICVPGTNTCQTINHVTVDTGSSGLRIVSTVLSISLPPANDSKGNPLDECLVFLDGYVWGPVATADIIVAGEKASSVPVQVMIPSSGSPPLPSSCSSQSPPGSKGNEGGSVDAFGANALIGVGLFLQDCGPVCVSNSPPPPFYYDCPGSGCNPINVTLAQQVANPVAGFAADNNGVLIQLPSVPDGGSGTASGFLIFGIGTQSNNGLGSSMVYPVPETGNNAGNFTTTFSGTSYPGSFIDSGSNALFLLDTATTGIPTCATPNNIWYCPSTSPDSLTAVNQGSDGKSGPTTHFSIEDANTLFSNGNNTAFSTLGGPNPGLFDWGLSFFFGRDVFTAIENMSTPGGTGPYYAYDLP